MCGEKAETIRLPLKTSDTHSVNKFERKSLDKFNYEIETDIGKLVQVKISQDGKGAGSEWEIEYVQINIPQQGMEYVCQANRWLKASEGEIILPVTTSREVDIGESYFFPTKTLLCPSSP